MCLNKAVIIFLFSLFISQSVSAQNIAKDQVTQLYKDYFCPADQIDPQWNGDFLKINQGTVSAEYKNATLKRLMFMRALAGINNNIEINETLSTQAQQLSFFFSINGNDHVASNAWDPFKIVNANVNNPEFDPYYIFRLYSPNLQEIAKVSHMSTYDTIANGLIDIIAGKNGEDGSTSGGEGGHSHVYPVSSIKLLSPQLTSVGIGSVETNTPVKLRDSDTMTIENISSGVLTTNNFDLNIAGGADFNPIVWPPAGYVPYMVSGPKWIAYQPGADFRGAYVSVKASNDPSFQYKAKLLERDAGTPNNMISWSMYAFMRQGQPFNDIRFTVLDRNYEVTIGNILFNGQVKELKYNVTEYNPFSDFTKTRLKIDILNKIAGSYANTLRIRTYSEDGCLVRVREPDLAEAFPGGKKLIITAKYSTSPEGPFNVHEGSYAPGVHDVISDDLDKEGFYQFILQIMTSGTTAQPATYTPLLTSEVFQLSNIYGFRRLNEQFKEPLPVIDIITIDNKIKSPAPGGPRPEFTPAPEQNGGDDSSGNTNSALEKMMKKFKKLKAKNKQCKLKKKQNSCRDSKCQTQCGKTKKNFTALKAEITRMTGVRPK